MRIFVDIKTCATLFRLMEFFSKLHINGQLNVCNTIQANLCIIDYLEKPITVFDITQSF